MADDLLTILKSSQRAWATGLAIEFDALVDIACFARRVADRVHLGATMPRRAGHEHDFALPITRF